MKLVKVVRDEFDHVGASWRGGTIVVAVSGGADSMALLDALEQNVASLSISLHVAHVDHGLRANSILDLRHVAEAAESRGLPFWETRLDIAEQARLSRTGIEETGRRARYDFLFGLADRIGAVAVATGHTADDQVETILMHILRGSGARGLRGMEKVAPMTRHGAGPVLWRPFLGVSREDTLQYCRDRRLAWREDPSNLDRRFTRNRVRHELLPLMRSFNPNVDSSLLRLSTSIRADDNLLADLTTRAWTDLTLASDEMKRRWGDVSGVAFDLAGFMDLAPALKRRLLLRAADEVSGRSEAQDGARVEAIVEYLPQARVGAIVELPGGVRVVRSQDAFLVTSVAESIPGASVTDETESAKPTILAIPGETVLPSGQQIVARRVDHSCGQRGPGHVDIAERLLAPPLVVRRRQPGDRFRPSGGVGSRKLSDILIDAKVPRGRRDQVPVVADQNGIVWVAGIRAADRAAVSDPSSQGASICLTLEPSSADEEGR